MCLPSKFLHAIERGNWTSAKQELNKSQGHGFDKDSPINRDSAFIVLIIVTNIFVIVIVVAAGRDVGRCCGTHDQ
jgi:hypothetical protein